jgi:hypothetical protein
MPPIQIIVLLLYQYFKSQDRFLLSIFSHSFSLLEDVDWLPGWLAGAGLRVLTQCICGTLALRVKRHRPSEMAIPCLARGVCGGAGGRQGQ